MAARKRKVALSDDWKANIQATMIMNRLYGHALGDIEMEKSQIDAAKVILAKILPDLKAMELTGANGGPMAVMNITPEERDAEIARLLNVGASKRG